jgi:hypothetical protein
MQTSVSATECETGPKPTPHPRAAWATFLREVCAGCHIGTGRADDFADSEQ